MAKLFPDACLIRYDRQGSYLRITLTGVTNHELREVLCGLWARLDPDDRRDHIEMLRHYANVLDGPEEGFLSGPAQLIKDASEGTVGISLGDLPSPQGP